MSGFQLQKWCDLCSRCHMLVTSIKKQNRLVDQMKELVFENNSITVPEVINMFGILFGLVQRTVTDIMNM
jgi:hypothetical protein